MTSKVEKKKTKKQPKVTERKIKRKEWFNQKQKQFKKGPQISLEDLSESDFDSNDELSAEDEEYGTLTDTEDESDSELELPEPSDPESEDERKPKVQRDTEKDLRTIFVGNLPHIVCKKRIHKYFSKYGEVENIRLRCPPVADPSIPKKVATINKDFHNERTNIIAFVCFKNEEFAKKALEANNALFGTYRLRVDLSVKKQQRDPKKAIFIGNLPFSAEEDQVRDIFADCGDIESIRIVRDKNTCVGKGFGYVNFCERTAVPLALEHDGALIGKRPIRVKKVDYSQKSNKKQPQNNKDKWETKKKKFSIKDKKERKEIFQGELAKKMQKKKSFKKTRLQKKKEVFKKILNQPSKKTVK